jgi:spore coat polysaccharide biosynthesis predicted glycosyltransferase SpsG
MKQKLAFRVDASKKIGIGHLIRLINLSKKLNLHSTWLVKGNKSYANKFLPINDTVLYIKNSIDEKTAIKYLINNNIKKIIFDISHRKNVEENADVKLIKIYKKNDFKIISYEISTNKNLKSDISIVPYNLKKRVKTHNKNLLFLGPEYLGIKNSKKNKLKKIKKILICIGGADIYNLGLRIFKLFLNTNYQITYISGQNKNKFNLRNSKHHVFSHIKDIKKTIENNDLIVCGEGLIKYEAIYSNKPIFLAHQFERKSDLIKKFLEKEVCASYKAKIINSHFKIKLIEYINNTKLIQKHLNNQYLKFIKKNSILKFKKLIIEIKRL